MVPALKVALAALVIATGGLIGAAIGGAFNFTEVTDKVEPPKVVRKEPATFSFLTSEITDGNATYAENTVGNKYKNYLVGTYGKTNNGNQQWWKESYERYQADNNKTQLSEEFTEGKIDKAFDDKSKATNSKALNQVCDSLYKKQLTDSVNKNSEGNGTKYKKALWIYCSDLKGVPQTVSDHDSKNIDSLYKSGSDDLIGKTKKTDLLSTQATINSKLWSWKQDEFFALEESKVTEKHFKDAYAQKSNKLKDKAFLKSICDAAYKKKSESEDADEKVKDITVVKYCSLTGQGM